MYLWISLSFIYLVIIYFFNRRRTEEIIIENEVPAIEQKKEILLRLNTDSVKFSFYYPITFKSIAAKNLYKRIIVDQLMIDEPFHSDFVKILRLIDQSESWIKSKNTKELKLKIRKNNGKFERGTSFKVYSLRDLSFQFSSEIFEYLKRNKSTKIYIQNTLLAVLLFNIYNVKEIKYLCNKDLTDEELTLCLSSIILENYTYKNEILEILNLIQQNHSSVKFILKIYDEAVRWQQEFPYIEKEGQDINELDISCLLNQKKLIAIDAF